MTEPTQNLPGATAEPRQEKLPLSWQDSSGQTEAAAKPETVPAAAAPLSAPAPTPAKPSASRRLVGATLTPPPVPIGPAAMAPTTAPRPEGAVAGNPRPLKLGRMLRDAREKLNVSAVQISQRTKIPKEFIENVESGQVDAFPPPVYCKSYLRQLCKEYALESAPVLDEYRKATVGGEADNEREAPPFVVTSKQAETGAKVGYQPRSPKEDGGNMRKLSPTTIAVCAVLTGLVVLGVIVFALNRSRSGRSGTETVPGQVVAQGEKLPIESFITPQQLPLKELPFPNR